MKRLFLLFSVLLLLVFPVSAENVDGGTEESLESVATDVTNTEEPLEPVDPDFTDTEEPLEPVDPDFTDTEEPLEPVDPDFTDTEEPLEPVDPDFTDIEEPLDPVVADVINTEEGVTVNVTIEQPEIPQEPVAANVQTDLVDLYRSGTFSVTQPDVLETIQSDGDVSVMVDVIENILGEYRRQTYTVEEFDMEGNLISSSTMYVEGLAGLDYHWLAGAAIFLMFFTGSFKLLGGLIR